MTPNPNPSPELRERLQTRLTAHLSGDRRDDRNWPLVIDAGDLAEIVAALSPQTLPAPGEVETFVQLLRNRADSRDQMGYDATADQIREAADMIERLATLATVAAANDEGVAEALRPFVLSIGDHVPDDKLMMAFAHTAGDYRRLAAAAIRLLSQRGGGNADPS